VVIHDQPTPVAIAVDKAESRRATNWLAGGVTSRANKGVGPGVDGKVTIDAKPLLTKDTRQRLYKTWSTLLMQINPGQTFAVACPGSKVPAAAAQHYH
jgi:hypothetical protein